MGRQGSALRPLKVLIPGLGRRFRCGGLAVEQQLVSAAQTLQPAELVTYRQQEAGYSFLDHLLRQWPATTAADAPLWLVSWGFHVPRLLRRLQGRAVAYHAHSAGYGFQLPPAVPVLAVSRNTLGYWGARSPRNPLFLLPNLLDSQFANGGEERQIDVLVQQRKTSSYVLRTLVPALRARGLKVEVQREWVADLAALFNRSRVYLYDSADHWRQAGVSEGFGLPPLEAMACGCVVFSSLNHALADHFTPGVNCFQVGAGTLDADVERICGVCRGKLTLPATTGAAVTAETLQADLWRVLQDVNCHWDRLASGAKPLLPQPLPLGTRLKRWLRRWR